MNIKLKDINGNPANPRTIRDKAFQDLKRSIAQFPQMLEKRPIAVIKDAGKWVAIGGNQRTKALIDLQRDIKDDDFADRYKTEPDAVALLTGYFAKGIPCVDCTDLTADQQRRFIIADNLPFGEWDTDALANEWDVDELQEWGMPDFVFGGDMSEDDEHGGGSLDEGKYTQKVETPVYEPKNEKPEINELYNEDRYKELLSEIENSGVSDDVKNILRIAASRHIVFNYEKMADFYAHSEKEAQVLMENSALVIIDFNRAIELGYVKLSEEIASQCSEDYGDNQ